MDKRAFSLLELSISILIIGILTAALTISENIIYKYKISNAQRQTQESVVNTIPDIFAWLETTSENAFNNADIDDGDKVETWNDRNPQSYKKNNFTQSSEANRPTYRENIINGLPILRFDNLNSNYLYINSLNSSDIAANDQITIFFVLKITSESTIQVLFSLNQENSNRIGVEFNNNIPRFDYPNDSDGLLSASSNIYNSLKILTFVKKSSTQSIYVNGSQEAVQNNSLSLTNFTSQLKIGLFQGDWGATSMDLGEVIVFSRGLKDSEREKVEEYLSKKWKIKLN